MGYIAQLCLMKQNKKSRNRDSGTERDRARKRGTEIRDRRERRERKEENFAACFPNSFLTYCVVSILDCVLNCSLLTAILYPTKIDGLILM